MKRWRRSCVVVFKRVSTQELLRLIDRKWFLSSLLISQFLPVFEALQDLAFEAALDRLVEFLAGHAVGEVVLAREAVLGIVVVLVAAAVADLLHQLGRGIEDVHRRRQRAVLPGRALGGAERRVAGVRFRRRAEV